MEWIKRIEWGTKDYEITVVEVVKRLNQKWKATKVGVGGCRDGESTALMTGNMVHKIADRQGI